MAPGRVESCPHFSMPWKRKVGSQTGLEVGVLFRSTQNTMAPREVLHHLVMDLYSYWRNFLSHKESL